MVAGPHLRLVGRTKGSHLNFFPVRITLTDPLNMFVLRECVARRRDV
jgi:hypothetical protein